MTTRVLVAGIGNIFLGDDGFGVEVARRLRDEPLPDGVDVADFGIRGVHLAYELAEARYDAVILVDAVPRGEPPGTLFVIEPGANDCGLRNADCGSEPYGSEACGSQDCGSQDFGAADAHNMTPAAVLAWLRRIGSHRVRITIVGCEPASLDESMGLSAPVAAAVGEAMRIVRELVAPEKGATSCA
jgi:hydrogenase maturation protease